MDSTTRRSAWRVAILFALLAGLWFLLSDLLLIRLASDPVWLTRLETVKDALFVAATAVLLYFMLQRELQQLARRDTQIREIEERLRLQSTALESAANAIVITDREGRVTWVNPAFTHLTGYTSAEMVSQSLRLLKSGSHDQAFYARLWETILSGRVWHGEMVNRRKDGSLYVEEQTITPVREAGGEISHFIGIKQDVTTRRYADEALRQSEQKLRNLVEKISDWVWEIDERNRYTYVSPKVREILGYTPEEVLGKTPFDLMPLEEAKRVAEIFAPITGQMQPFVLLDNVCLHKDGHRVVLETSGTPIFDSQGVFRGYRGIDRDITERKRAEEEIRSLARFPAENPNPVLRLNRDGRILYANESSQALLQAWGCAVGGPAPPPWPETVGEALASQSSSVIDVPCGALIYSFFVAPIPATGYVNLYGLDVTERRRAAEALAERTRQLEAVRAVSAEMTRELDLTNLLDLVHRRAAELVDAKRGAILLWDEATQRLIPRAWHGYDAWVGDVRLCLGEGVAGTVAERQAGMIVNDYRNASFAHPLFLERNLDASTLCEPLLYRERLLGVILLADSRSDHQFSGEDQQLLRLFAAQAAIAIENARLHETAVRRAQQLATLTELTRVLTTALDIQTAAREVLAAVQVLIPGAVGRLWEWAEGEEVLRTVASAGLQNPEGAYAPAFRPREGMTGIAAATRQPVICPDVSQDPRFRSKAWAATENIVSCIVLPLVYGERVTGVLSIYTREPHEFTDEEVRLLSSFTAQAAIAIENARLHSAAVRRGEQLEALLRATRSLMSDLDLQGTLDRIVQEASEMAATPHVSVMFVDRAAGVLTVAALAGDPVPVGFAIPLGQDLSGIVAETGRPLFSADSPNDPRNLLAERDRQLGFVTYLGLPIKVGNEVFGVLSFDTTVPRRYSPSEVAYLESFAAQAAIAIEKARLYQEIRQHAATLELRVKERTRELEEARTRAEEVSRHKSEFLANMSHELRTPLNSIIGFSQILREDRADPPNEKQAQCLDYICHAGEHLIQLVNDILDLSKVEAGKLTLQPEPVPVAAALEDFHVIACALAKEKGQTLEVLVESNLPLLRADPVRFKQICLNLLSNAVKFTPNGGRITLSARRASGQSGNPALGQPGASPERQSAQLPDCLEIQVSDTGIGIKPDDLPRLFQEFVQLESATTDRREGTGLGLALTKRLVELHGGRIWAASEGKGRGSTFTVLLPFAGPGA
jgi:PAS domain S-box-containing protein